MSSRLPASVRRLPLRVRVAAAIERLPDAQRLVLALHLLEGYSVLETAAALRVTTREVEARMAAAFDVLADELGSRQAGMTLKRAA